MVGNKLESKGRAQKVANGSGEGKPLGLGFRLFFRGLGAFASIVSIRWTTLVWHGSVPSNGHRPSRPHRFRLGVVSRYPFRWVTNIVFVNIAPSFQFPIAPRRICRFRELEYELVLGVADGGVAFESVFDTMGRVGKA